MYKDNKSIIEELSTTNGEFKKVNEFLITEIEQLKRENDFLKVELLKMHMSDSLNDLSTASTDTNATTSTQNTSSISNSSSSINTSSNASNPTQSSSSNYISTEYSATLTVNRKEFSTDHQTDLCSPVFSQVKQNEKSQIDDNSNICTNRIDLSRYINNDDDSDAEIDDDIFSKSSHLDDSYTSTNLPPNEFTID